jgi:hypothetical protein
MARDLHQSIEGGRSGMDWQATTKEDHMDQLNLDYEEFQQVVHLSSWLPPGSDLKVFLLNHLRHRLPATASKIERLAEREVDILSEQIAAHRKGLRFEPSRN